LTNAKALDTLEVLRSQDRLTEGVYASIQRREPFLARSFFAIGRVRRPPEKVIRIQLTVAVSAAYLHRE
jgi:hypothetical protein